MKNKQTNQMSYILKLSGYTLVFCLLRDFHNKNVFKNQNCRPGEMPQQVSVLASLAEAQHQIPAPILGGAQLPITLAPKDTMPSSGFCRYQHARGAHKRSRHTPAHKINKQISNKLPFKNSGSHKGRHTTESFLL